ncbi:Transmembrane protein 144 [Geodia barretti]|uniref:Transmembrane protein 144 n=1 Tax=Geodia barretti TaxID=519541 RepID=A0AA35T679_GEOBA|nr:Transmembrane protein 144 [Geodia barretti]
MLEMFLQAARGSSLLLLLVVLWLEVSHAWTPREPENVFCYSTAGGSAGRGGEIVPGRCGETCSARVDKHQWLGWLGVIVAVLFLGSTYVVVKQFDSADGMFFQWVLCIGIWMVGLVVNMTRYQPPFFLPSLIAGLLWSVGNVLVVPIVKLIGLAVGMTLWSMATLVSGWIAGVFIFDQELRCAPLNYVGVAIIITSALMLMFVRSDGKNQPNSRLTIQSTKSVLDNSIDTLLSNRPRETKDWVEKLGAWPRRVLGVSAAMLAGCIFGGQFIPIEYLKLCNDPEHSCEDLDYLFGYYTGILAGGTAFLAVYSAFKRNRPWTNPGLILPGIVAGIMWGIGSVGVFLANKYLSLAISIPFITTCLGHSALQRDKGLEAPIAICRSSRSKPVWTDNGGSVSLCHRLSSWTQHSTKQLANPHFPKLWMSIVSNVWFWHSSPHDDLLGVFLVSVTGGSASGWSHEEEEEDYSLLLLGRRSNSSEGTSWKPGSPSTWICYSTAGSITPDGGHVNMSSCGDGGKESDVWVGWVGVVIAVVFFGSNFIPVKKFDTGDGLFFQWMLCIGIWLVGLVVNMILLMPPFFIPSLLGGFLWTTGNLMAVSIIKMIGLTMGLTVWGVTNMLSGWFIGTVILKESMKCAPLNYSAVAIVVISVIVLAFVKSSGKKTDNSRRVAETSPLLAEQDSLEGSLRDKVVQRESGRASIQNSYDKLTFSPSARNGGVGSQEWDERDEDYSWTDKLGVWPRRIIGFSLALVAGVFFGTQFIVIEYMKLCTDRAHSCSGMLVSHPHTHRAHSCSGMLVSHPHTHRAHSCSDINYLFGHYSGILLASTFYFVVYCLLMKNRPRVYPKAILPGLLSGIMWGIAMVGWFLANQRLSLAVSFPIITAVSQTTPTQPLVIPPLITRDQGSSVQPGASSSLEKSRVGGMLFSISLPSASR